MNTVAATNTFTATEYLENVCLTSLNGQFQVAIWRKPHASKVEIVLDSSGDILQVSTEIEKLPAGFILHPFSGLENEKAFFIPAETYLSFDLDQNTYTELPEQLVQATSKAGGSLREKIWKAIKRETAAEKPTIGLSTTKESFVTMVEKARREISDKTMFKVVAAKTKHLPLTEEFDLVGTFLALCRAYPNSFVNFFHIPGIGTWIGATPEVLIQTKGTTFHTMALAGTQRGVGENPLKTAAWTQKEIEEQALVSRYIVSCFKKIRLREYDEIGPKTSMAGNLLHLKSDFYVDMEATGFPQLGSVMLNLLHPTSAVCGMPKDTANAFIQSNEGFDRSFFAGYLGPINIQEETQVYVNLRCGRILENGALLYAGAGITEDSDPEKEWEETEMKCEIIRKYLINPERT
ncbi:MAG: chorismate-binding protein [Lunatimonas sp.]|uniref:chorismate-binding protein n=1 Tax=Lunatimonas sp. TaxID=2060141 RepID=UPI00263A8FFB|nr:chorismate-binding protein [Lunatimonas sp.]MCC5939492.1 chorismate-binding protein [Lunatimonas sp.]